MPPMLAPLVSRTIQGFYVVLDGQLIKNRFNLQHVPRLRELVVLTRKENLVQTEARVVEVVSFMGSGHVTIYTETEKVAGVTIESPPIDTTNLMVSCPRCGALESNWRKQVMTARSEDG